MERTPLVRGRLHPARGSRRCELAEQRVGPAGSDWRGKAADACACYHLSGRLLLIIRKQQMEAFERSTVRAFEDRTYRHLRQWFPHHCELLGEEQMRHVISHGWQKANSYELTAECCVRSYIEFMCLLGGGFDCDVLLPWAARILKDRSDEQIIRGDRLYHQTWRYIDHIAKDYRDASGQPTTARFMSDLRQLRHGGNEMITPSGTPAFVESQAMRLELLFPAKCEFVGPAILREAIDTGVTSARDYGIVARRGLILFTAMKFVLGGGFDDDPLLPWASPTLRDPAITDQERRIDKLYAEGVSFLGRWWKLSSGQEV
jgi:hypothetical protein